MYDDGASVHKLLCSRTKFGLKMEILFMLANTASQTVAINHAGSLEKRSEGLAMSSMRIAGARPPGQGTMGRDSGEIKTDRRQGLTATTETIGHLEDITGVLRSERDVQAATVVDI